MRYMRIPFVCVAKSRLFTQIQWSAWARNRAVQIRWECQRFRGCVQVRQVIVMRSRWRRVPSFVRNPRTHASVASVYIVLYLLIWAERGKGFRFSFIVHMHTTKGHILLFQDICSSNSCCTVCPPPHWTKNTIHTYFYELDVHTRSRVLFSQRTFATQQRMCTRISWRCCLVCRGWCQHVLCVWSRRRDDSVCVHQGGPADDLCILQNTLFKQLTHAHKQTSFSHSVGFNSFIC